MPRMTGTDLALKLLAIRPDIPIILCTGHSELINEKRARRMGIAAFLMKPVRLNTFSAVIRRLLDAKKPDDADH